MKSDKKQELYTKNHVLIMMQIIFI